MSRAAADRAFRLWKQRNHDRITVYPDRPAWLQGGRTILGASEVASIYGLRAEGYSGVFGTPFSVWAAKVGPEPDYSKDDPGSLRMQLGLLLEPVIVNIHCNKTGHLIHDLGDFTRVHGDKPHHACTPDRLVYDPEHPDRGVGVLEIKTADLAKAKEWEDEPPLAYQLQLTWQMYCCNVQWGVVACLLSRDKFVHHTVLRRDDRVYAITKKVDEFWQDHVVNGEPPPVDGADATTEALKAMYPESNGAIKTLPYHFLELDAELEQVKAEIKPLEARKKAIENAFKLALEDAEIGELPHCRYRYGTIEREGYVVQPTKYRRLTRSKKG